MGSERSVKVSHDLAIIIYRSSQQFELYQLLRRETTIKIVVSQRTILCEMKQANQQLNKRHTKRTKTLRYIKNKRHHMCTRRDASSWCAELVEIEFSALSSCV